MVGIPIYHRETKSGYKLSVRKPEKLIHLVNHQTMPITCITLVSRLEKEIINLLVDE
jgi:hypothetical protein